MRARMVAKSSAARGLVTSPPLDCEPGSGSSRIFRHGLPPCWRMGEAWASANQRANPGEFSAKTARARGTSVLRPLYERNRARDERFTCIGNTRNRQTMRKDLLTAVATVLLISGAASAQT